MLELQAVSHLWQESAGSKEQCVKMILRESAPVTSWKWNYEHNLRLVHKDMNCAVATEAARAAN